ncbi:hypothetical protein AcW1_005392 [Taiwanofungus camphoratus]|nr:hypothetical protein AcW2_004158 [Antrodia cinnamomea]KAI0933607.1 hypothetical protein AcV5_005710 [Antrodia cinnamomea]KAI0948601.1 hypothetical protein AcV7_009296 [Antrodia cinnamomea]KAI0956798.1 hypothetical protein AcW1_005392 [Antrodia cinnamomea]
MSLEHLLNSDVPDPTDFPSEAIAPGLRQLDDALRCSICGELYEAPVTLNCGHCYCSLCIRSALSDKAECPICRQSASESHLRKNLVVESSVKAWTAARDFMLRVSKEEEARNLRNTATEGNEQKTRSNVLKKRKRQRSVGTSSDDDIQIVSGPSGQAIHPIQPKEEVSNHRRSPDTPTTPESSKALVECPVCQKQAPLQTINAHIDSNCRMFTGEASSRSAIPGPKGKQKQEWSKILGGGGAPSRKGKEKDRAKSETMDAEYLPKVSYHTLKDKKLAELLNEHELPVNGDRNALIRRHSKWVMLYNANIDRTLADRKTVEQLRRDLKRWDTEGREKKQVVTDTTAYQRANKVEFALLVEAARPKKSPDKRQSGGQDPQAFAGFPGNDGACVSIGDADRLDRTPDLT